MGKVQTIPNGFTVSSTIQNIMSKGNKNIKHKTYSSLDPTEVSGLLSFFLIESFELLMLPYDDDSLSEDLIIF